jgi:hypothetical protein
MKQISEYPSLAPVKFQYMQWVIQYDRLLSDQFKSNKKEEKFEYDWKLQRMWLIHKCGIDLNSLGYQEEYLTC